jgi:hypothetical protein
MDEVMIRVTSCLFYPRLQSRLARTDVQFSSGKEHNTRAPSLYGE